MLSLPADRTYITVEPDQSAESYVAQLQDKYNFILGLSVIYIFLYAAVWAVLSVWRRLRGRKQALF